MRLGATGGYMGHVLLATSTPRPVHRGTTEAMGYQGVWPEHHDVRTLWRVSTIESTRAQEGFHESIYLIYIDDKTGRIITCGEEHHDQYIKFEFPVKMEVWQCPRALRTGFRLDIMHFVLAQMKQHEASWSWTTAVRAFFLSAQVQETGRRTCVDAETALDDIQECWKKDPICTSMVVVFWQRYICELAGLHNSHSNAAEVRALDWIMQFMPLKSDRALPGDVVGAMEQCGWVLVSRLPEPTVPHTSRARYGSGDWTHTARTVPRKYSYEEHSQAVPHSGRARAYAGDWTYES